MNATKAEHEKTVARLWDRFAELKDQLEKESVEFSVEMQCPNKRQDDVSQMKYRKEKTAVDRQIVELQDKVKSRVFEHVSTNAKLSKTQVSPECETYN